MVKDNLKKKCKKCGKGKYVETSIQDDWDGVLHCNKCGTSIQRYDMLSPKVVPDFIPASCRGEKCSCGAQARHKVEEVLFTDDPTAFIFCTYACEKPLIGPCRHPSTAYLCSKCFGKIMGKTTIPGFRVKE